MKSWNLRDWNEFLNTKKTLKEVVSILDYCPEFFQREVCNLANILLTEEKNPKKANKKFWWFLNRCPRNFQIEALELRTSILIERGDEKQVTELFEKCPEWYKAEKGRSFEKLEKRLSCEASKIEDDKEIAKFWAVVDAKKKTGVVIEKTEFCDAKGNVFAKKTIHYNANKVSTIFFNSQNRVVAALRQ